MTTIQTTPVCNDSKAECIQTPQEMACLEVMLLFREHYIAARDGRTIDAICNAVGKILTGHCRVTRK